MASDGNFVDVSEFGVSGRRFVADWAKKLDSCKFSFSCIVFVEFFWPGTINRLILETLSRNDSAGLGGACGRCIIG